MINRLKNFLEGNAGIKSLTADGEEPKSEELQIATAVLLLEMAGRDQDFAPEEVKAIFLQMRTQFGVSEDQELMALMEKAAASRDSAEKIDSFVEMVNTEFSEEQRATIVAMAWKVVLADGAVEKDEKRFAKQLGARLKLTEEVYENVIARVNRGEF